MKELIPKTAARRTGQRLLGIGTVLLVYAGLTAGLYRGMTSRASEGTPSVQVVAPAAPPRRNVSIKEGQFYADGAPFFINAVGWDPARPGELPWTRQFNLKDVEADFSRIRAAGFNTIRTWASLRREELELAQKHGLRVLQGVWTPPDADFLNVEVRRRTLSDVSRQVEGSRWSSVIIGYLVMNEPRASAVAHAGLTETRSFLREVAAVVRTLDASAPIGYASWPGMEALDDELFDFVAFNLYPHRPRVVMDELGLQGYLHMLKTHVARGRPLIISEFGLSVSPTGDEAGRGGLTPEAQASGLVELKQQFSAAGVAGTAVFQWNDGWWKNNDQSGDELTQDPKDPEEWFGLLAFQGPQDRVGTPRPALEALSVHGGTVVLEPRDGELASAKTPVRVWSEQPVVVTARINGGDAIPVLLQGSTSQVGTLSIPGGSGRSDVTFELFTPAGELIRREKRLLAGAPRAAGVSISPQWLRVRPGEAFEVAIRVEGKDLDRRRIRVSSYTEAQHREDRVRISFDRSGVGKARLRAPEEKTMLTLIAFEDDPALPSGERAAAFATVEVRP